jgi:hypothetical protein
MFGYAGRHRRDGRRTGVRGRLSIGHGRNLVGRRMVEGFGPSLDGLTMVEGLDLSPGDRIMARGPDRSRVGRVTAGEFGLSLDGLTMVEGLDLNPDVPTLVGAHALNPGVPTMVGARRLNRVGLMGVRDRNLRGLTMGRGLRRGGPVAGPRVGRRPSISLARHLLDRLRLIGVLKRLPGVISGRSRNECVAAHR